MSGSTIMQTPCKIERFGIRAHGLVKCPITYTGSSGVCYLRDYTLTTRGGKIIPMPYSEAEKELSFAPALCPRPFLYQHPLAIIETEDAEGLDWSGYVIFYQYTRNNYGYLNNFIGAFTPDDNSQSLLFKNEFTYSPPLIIGGANQPDKQINPFYPELGVISGISKDGRFRIKGEIPLFIRIDITQTFYNFYYFNGYNLIDDSSGGIYAQEQAIDQPVIHFEKMSTDTISTDEYFRVIEARYGGVRMYPYGGGCHTEVESMPAFTFASVPNTNDKTITSGSSKIPVDMYADDQGNVYYLYCSYDLLEEQSFHIEETIVRDELSWGDDCFDMYGGGKVPYRDWEILRKRDDIRYSTTTISVEMLQDRSELVLDWNYNYSVDVTNSFSGDSNNPNDEIIDTIENSNEVNISVRLDDDELYSLTFLARDFNESRPSTNFVRKTFITAELPEVFENNESGNIFYALEYRDPSYYPGVRLDFIIEVCVSNIMLGDGIHALCVFLSYGKASEKQNQSLMDQRLLVGRVFGFGTSNDGFEVPKSDWDKKLYAAYDPVSKTISDTYTHPVFYQ